MMFSRKAIKLAATSSALWLSSSSVLAGQMSARRLQYVEDCTECLMFSIDPIDTFVVWGFQFETQLETCMHVQVWYFDGALGTIPVGGTEFAPDPDSGWIKLCDGYTKGMGPGSQTTISQDSCQPLEIQPESHDHSFHLKAVSCVCNDVDHTIGATLDAAECANCEPQTTNYYNMSDHYGSYFGEQCMAVTNYPTVSPTGAPNPVVVQATNDPPVVVPCTLCQDPEDPLVPDGKQVDVPGNRETIAQGSPATINALDTASDPESPKELLKAVQIGACPFTIEEDGSITGEETLPAGVYTCGFEVMDPEGLTSSPAEIRITVIEAVDDPYEASVGVPLSAIVLDNDVPSDILEVTSTTCQTGAHGTFTGPAVNGAFTYTPDVAGTYTCEYTVITSDGTTDTATITINAVEGNAAPVANDDTASGVPSTPVAGNVIDNDADPNGDTLTIAPNGENDCASKGIVFDTVKRDGSYTADLTTTTTCTYTVADPDGATATATLTIVIDAPPVAVDDVYTTDVGVPVTTSVLDNDSDPENGALSVISDTCSGFAVNADGTFNPNTFTTGGTYVCDYTVQDPNGNTATATITVNVNNDGPVAEPDTYYGTATEPITETNGLRPTLSPDTTGGVLDNDSDPNNHIISVKSNDCETKYPTELTSLVLNAEGGITATFSEPGTYNCQYTIEDQYGAEATASLTFYVQAKPDAVDDTIPVEGLYYDVEFDLFDNDSDPENNDLTVLSVGQDNVACELEGSINRCFVEKNLSCGSIYLKDSGDLTFSPLGGTACADGDKPTFEYTISDGNGGQDTATVTLEASNVAPVANLDIFPQTTPVTKNILANDFDGDCEYKDCPEVNLQVTMVSTPGKILDANGNPLPTPSPECADPASTCTITGTDCGGTLEVQNDTGDVMYTPDADGCPIVDGVRTLETFEYCIKDNQGGTSCSEIRFDVNVAPIANDNQYTLATFGIDGGDVSVSGNIIHGDYDPDGPEFRTNDNGEKDFTYIPEGQTEQDLVDWDKTYSALKVTKIGGIPFAGEGTMALGDGTLTVDRDGEMTYALNGGLAAITDNSVTFTYTISDFFGGTDSATVTIDIEGGVAAIDNLSVPAPERQATATPTKKPTSKPTLTSSPTRSPVSAAPVTSRPTAAPATPSYLIEVVDANQITDSEGRYQGADNTADALCGDHVCGGAILGPKTYETISGGSVTYQFVPDSCYSVAPYDEDGMINGHFDADWVDLNPGWPGNGHTNDHKHTYDDNCQCTWVDYFTPTDFIPITQTSPFDTQLKRDAKFFKIIIINDNLNRRGLVAINNKLESRDADGNPDYNFLNENPDSYFPVIQYVQTPVDDLPVYTLGDYHKDNTDPTKNYPDVTKLTNLALGYHADAVTSGPYGIVPSATGSMKSNLPGLNGEWRTGALTIQLVKVICTASGCTDDFVLDPTLSNSTNQGNMGPVKPPADPNNFIEDPVSDANKVFFEGTLFWHGGDESYICGDYDQSTGECFDQAARDAFYAWYDELYGGGGGSGTDAAACAQELCCVIIDGAPLDQKPAPTIYTFDDIRDDHTISAIFSKIGTCPACSAAPTSAPTVSAAPSISRPPSIAPTLSHAPTVSQMPTEGADFSVPQDTEKCFGYAEALNDCFKGAYYSADGSSDGNKAEWTDGVGVACGGPIPLNKAPSGGDDSNACPTDNLGGTQDGVYRDGISSGTWNELEGTSCVEIETTYHTGCSADALRTSTLDGIALVPKDANTLDPVRGVCIHDGGDCKSQYYGEVTDPDGLDCDDSKCHAEPLLVDAGATSFCKDKNRITTIATSPEPSACNDDLLNGDNRARYIVTVKVADKCRASTKTSQGCYISQATAQYYDWTAIADNTRCPDYAGTSLSTLTYTGDLVHQVNFEVASPNEVLTASAYLWCGNPFFKDPLDETRDLKTAVKNKAVCLTDAACTVGKKQD